LRFFSLLVVLSLAACAPSQKARPAKRAPAPAPKPVAQAATAEQLEGIERTLQVGLTALTSCYTSEMERQGTKKFQGRVLYKILIGADQKAAQVVIGDESLAGPQMHKCMVSVIKGWEFPQLKTEMWFSRPIEFSPAY
jgi:hypothetical protein